MSRSPQRYVTLVYGVWISLCLAVVAGNMHYLRSVWLYEWNAAFKRAEVAAELAEQALLRSADGVGSVLDFAETRAELAADGAVDATAALDRRLQQLIEQRRFGLRGITAVRPDGVVSWSPSGEMIGTSVADREIFRRLIQPQTAQFVVSAPFVSRASGDWILAAGRALRDADGGLTGLIIIGFDPMHLSQLLTTVASGEERSLIVRQISDGQVRAASHHTHDRLAQGPVPDHPVAQAARQAGAGRLEYQQRFGGRWVMTAFRALPTRNLVVYAAFDRDVEMAPFHRIARPVLAAVLLYILASLMLAVVWERNARLRGSLQALATLDPLTGLYNRRALEERMQQHGTGHFACLLFDIDHFKSINDRFGHARGDHVLQGVARLLRHEVRGDDIVCRWGGEEMLVVLRHCDRDKALMRAEALRCAIEGLNDGPDRVTASVGVACFPGDGPNLQVITELADQAMYRAKSEGRNRVAMVKPAVVA